MKKRFLAIVLVAILAVCGYCLYMERHFSHHMLVETNLSEKQILKEMPEISITEQDLIMGQYVLSLPEVQDAFAELADSDEIFIDIPKEKSASLISDWTLEGFEVLELVVTINQVYVGFIKGDSESIYLHVFTDSTTPMEKSVAVYGKDFFGHDVCKVMYTNQKSIITKSVNKHQLFWWLTRNEGV